MRFILVLWLLLLAGCAALPGKNIPQAILSEHQQAVSAIEKWQLRGKLAVKNSEDSWSASVRWRQEIEDYRIELVGPLGQGSAKINGNGDAITLLTSEGEELYSEDPQSLLSNELGWEIPIKALRYWALGLPAPGDARQITDDDGRCIYIEQADWTVRLNSYKTVNDLELPTKISITRDDAKIKFIIVKWDLES